VASTGIVCERFTAKRGVVVTARSSFLVCAALLISPLIFRSTVADSPAKSLPRLPRSHAAHRPSIFSPTLATLVPSAPISPKHLSLYLASTSSIDDYQSLSLPKKSRTAQVPRARRNYYISSRLPAQSRTSAVIIPRCITSCRFISSPQGLGRILEAITSNH
jgi:hypothetical protein